MTTRWLADDSGVAAVEFALAATMLSVALLNVVDLGAYLNQAMQVESAAQMGTQAAFERCEIDQLPATLKCTELAAAVSTGIASTTLGNAIVLRSGFPTESYLCVDASNQLIAAGSLTSPSADCTAVGRPGVKPGLYLTISVAYPFKPILPGASVAALLGSTIRRSATMRLQ